jgi:hypothetical protein
VFEKCTYENKNSVSAKTKCVIKFKTAYWLKTYEN